MAVLFAGGQGLGERRHVQLVITRPVELEGLAGDEQERWGRIAVADAPTQVKEDLAQICTRAALRPFGPQQAGQRFPAMWPV
jgi:hypothetical protein